MARLAAAPPNPPDPPPSDTIRVTEREHDFRGISLTNKTKIVFDASGEYARAKFNSNQFGQGLISNTVNITGDEIRNFIEVTLTAPGSFSAAGWTFTNWVAYNPLQEDEITIRGTEEADTLTGSTQSDGLIGNGGNDILNGGDGHDSLVGGAGVDKLTGGTGNDSYHLFDVHRVSFFPLRFAFDDVTEAAGEGTDTVLVKRVGIVGGYTLGANVENAIVNGADSFNVFGNELENNLRGNFASNTFEGRGGNDTLDGGGGAGSDTASYASAPTRVSVSLAVAGPQNTLGAGTDTLTGFENLIGSGFGDTLTGDAGVNSLYGGAGADRLLGGDGNDLLVGGPGADQLDGGPGFNTVSYTDSAAGVSVSLPDRTASGGDAAGDTFVSVQKLIGSRFADVFLGGSAANLFSGGDGNDTLRSASGNDVLNGEAGNDVLEGGSGDDQVDGGLGTDRASYSSAANAVTVNLALAGAQNTVGAGLDTLVSIENLLGSAFGDTLLGNAGANAIRGEAGNDRLRGGSGADRLTGGTGADMFVFRSVADSSGTALDRITDLSSVDRLNLAAIDANGSGTGNGAFMRIGNSSAFTAAGQFRLSLDGDTTRLDLNTDTDAEAESTILLTGNHTAATADDNWLL